MLLVILGFWLVKYFQLPFLFGEKLSFFFGPSFGSKLWLPELYDVSSTGCDIDHWNRFLATSNPPTNILMRWMTQFYVDKLQLCHATFKSEKGSDKKRLLLMSQGLRSVKWSFESDFIWTQRWWNKSVDLVTWTVSHFQAGVWRRCDSLTPQAIGGIRSCHKSNLIEFREVKRDIYELQVWSVWSLTYIIPGWNGWENFAKLQKRPLSVARWSPFSGTEHWSSKL